MKRISILLAVSMLAPSLCQGYGRYSSDGLVRYSPYAFSYSSTGLIPGGVDYSPYAFGPGQSGLVYEGTRYTPYAFDYNHSGLVVDYYTYPIPICPVQVLVAPCCSGSQTSQAATAPHRATPTASYVRAEELRQIRQADAMYVIRQYLAGRGFGSIDINYLWSVENRTASISFILPDKGLAIRYSNPEILASLGTPAQKAVGERHKQAWETFAKDLQASGGSVYSISASDKDQIVAALNACQALKPQDNTATAAVMYARK